MRFITYKTETGEERWPSVGGGLMRPSDGRAGRRPQGLPGRRRRDRRLGPDASDAPPIDLDAVELLTPHPQAEQASSASA